MFYAIVIIFFIGTGDVTVLSNPYGQVNKTQCEALFEDLPEMDGRIYIKRCVFIPEGKSV